LEEEIGRKPFASVKECVQMKDMRFKFCEGDKKYKLNPNSTLAIISYVMQCKMGWTLARSHMKHWRTKCRISANENNRGRLTQSG
jgi:hypothetical protein